MSEFQLDLTDTVSSWPELAHVNIKELGDGWRRAHEMARLHSLALQRVSIAFGPKPSKQDETVLLLATHGLNLFIEMTGLIARGGLTLRRIS